MANAKYDKENLFIKKDRTAEARLEPQMAALAKKIIMAISMAAISAGIAIAALYSLPKSVESQRGSILSGDAIIVIRTIHSYLPGAFIGAIGVLLFALALLVFLYKESLYERMLAYCSWTCAIGVFTIFVGAIGINYYWHQSARSHGYVKCGATDRVSTTKMHTSYWVKNKKDCNNPRLSQLLSYPSDEYLKKANDYLTSRQEY